MPQFNVRLHFSGGGRDDEVQSDGGQNDGGQNDGVQNDAAPALDLEIYQRVHCAVGTPREAIIQCAKQQFLNWTRQRGAEWAEVSARLPSADISASEVLPASDGTTMLR